MKKYGVWFESDKLSQFCIDELEVDPKYNSYNFQGTFFKNILKTRGIGEVEKGRRMDWGNYMNLFKSLREAQVFIIKKAFRDDI